MRRMCAIAAALTLLCVTLDAYVFLGEVWPAGSIVMQLQLGSSSGVLLDGTTNWGQSAEASLATWNSYLNTVQFRIVRDSTAPIGDGNGYNNVFFSTSVYGDVFDSRTLAITTNWSVGSRRSEADVVFNTTLPWNSYSGPLRRAASGGTLYDLRRVSLHEFGHVLGLDHPDEFGQRVAAIMNSDISDLYTLQADDIAGAQALYNQTAPPPTLNPPGAPTGLVVSSFGSSVFLAWSAASSGGAPAAYIIEAGSAFGFANLANFSTGNTLTTFSTTGVGSGTYYVRVRAVNAAGTSAPSNEAVLVVGAAGCGALAAPGNFALTFDVGGTVSFAWTASPGATSYSIEAGSAPGLTNLANSNLGSAATSATFNGVGAGAYYVRLRARNAACGTISAPSNEVLLIVR